MEKLPRFASLVRNFQNFVKWRSTTYFLFADGDLSFKDMLLLLKFLASKVEQFDCKFVSVELFLGGKIRWGFFKKQISW